MKHTSPPKPVQPPKPLDDAIRNALARHAMKVAPRRFTGEPMTGFGGLA